MLSSMVSPTLCATRGGGAISFQQTHKFSACNSVVPTSIQFPRRKSSAFSPSQLERHSKKFPFIVKNQYSTPQEQNHQQQRFPPYESPSPSQPGQSPPRVYVGYSVYKGKAALTVEPRPPEFSPLDSGAFKLSKEGYVLLQFAPASGVRQYDWSRKQVFSLSVSEIGSVMSLGARDSCEFFHDPNKGKSDEGRVRKVLKVEPLPDGSGHFFNLSVQNKIMNLDENIYIPITKGEFAVLVSSFNFVLPYLLGWHTFANSIKPEDSNRLNNTNPRSADYEWSSDEIQLESQGLRRNKYIMRRAAYLEDVICKKPSWQLSLLYDPKLILNMAIDTYKGPESREGVKSELTSMLDFFVKLLRWG